MAIAGFLDRMCLALWASRLWLRYAALQNLIPSFPWIAPPRPPPWHNPRKGRDQILPSGNLDARGCARLAGLQARSAKADAKDDAKEDAKEAAMTAKAAKAP